MPDQQVRIADLAERIKAKRGTRSLRDVAQEIDVSFSTLSRVEQRRIPDLDTFVKLCSWLRIPPATFMITISPDDAGTNEEKVYAHLRADKTLSADTAESLITMIKQVYKIGDSSLVKSSKKTSRSLHYSV